MAMMKKKKIEAVLTGLIADALKTDDRAEFLRMYHQQLALKWVLGSGDLREKNGGKNAE